MMYLAEYRFTTWKLRSLTIAVSAALFFTGLANYEVHANSYGDFNTTFLSGDIVKALSIAEKALNEGIEAPTSNSNSMSYRLLDVGKALVALRRWDEAIHHLVRARALARMHTNHGHERIVTDLLAVALAGAGRTLEAEEILISLISQNRRMSGQHELELSQNYYDLGNLQRELGRLNEAERSLNSSLHLRLALLREDSPEVAAIMVGLGNVRWQRGNYSEAKAIYEKAVITLDKPAYNSRPEFANALNNLASTLVELGQFTEAMQLHRRALEIRKVSLGHENYEVSVSLNNLGNVYRELGLLYDAEDALRLALSIREKHVTPRGPNLASVLNNLALVYAAMNRGQDAERIYSRAIRLLENRSDAGLRGMGQILSNLGRLYLSWDQNDKAENTLGRAYEVSIRTRAPGHHEIANALNFLAMAEIRNRKFDKAIEHLQEALAIRKSAIGHTHPHTGITQMRLGEALRETGRLAEAQNHAESGLDILRSQLGDNHPETADAFRQLGLILIERRSLTEGFRYLQQAVAAQIKIAAFDFKRFKNSDERSASELAYTQLIRAAWVLGNGQRSAAFDPAFSAAQSSTRNSANGALSQMAARFASGSGPLAAKVRQAQDLAQLRTAIDRRLVNLIGADDSQQAGATAATLRLELRTTDEKLSGAALQLERDFPDYAELVSVAPLASEDVQGMLGPQEALVLLLVTPAATPTPEETFIWVVTKERSTWFRSKLGELGLSERVAALRCGLDNGEWEDEAKAKRCRELLGGKRLVRRLPFNNKALAIAHELYQELLAPAEDLITGKELIIVPTGPLTALPFHILLTAPPDMTIAAITEAHRKAAWLVRSHAITMLPAVASLKALRQTTPTRTPAPEPFIGIGDPVLGETTCPSPPPLSACPKGTPSRTMIASSDRVSGRYSSSNFRGGLAEAGELNKLPRLCDTAFELRCVGTTLKADPKALLLDAAATETAVKALSSSDRLLRYRVVHFATHGLLAGQLTGGDGTPQGSQLQEAGLVLTPPPPGSETDQDDGLLTASEIAALKLNADWVILSACNTAAGDKPGTEALSGLARAFFYAGSRALLVSHWPVASSAAVEITTATLQRLQAADGSLSRAEALRRSMLELLSSEPVSPIAAPTQIDKAHPSYWAPFVLVGDGGRP
ncbi:CHAT domain-containing tetratricopeptide repeat protein [Mesorhizobium sp. C395A]|uniref:tetratricopeptide repeat protein n=1 Tax=Mesorhizobium sp. C395A TaxID=2956832 RepID=UPI002574A927|nr:CHAT domain-containing tetratricopeptide repeat protein [Mesorhizobium sp. C395A]WJI76705.1 CHAT domain-containing protein [Mesorhizobium sp. C395A]